MPPNTLVTPVARSKKSDRFEMLVDPKWLKRVEKQADRLGMTVSAYVRMAVTRQLEQDEGGLSLPAAVQRAVESAAEDRKPKK